MSLDPAHQTQWKPPKFRLGGALRSLGRPGAFYAMMACVGVQGAVSWTIIGWMPTQMREQFNIGFSYDINTSTLRTASNGNGAFEFSLVYKICGPERRGVYCPNF